MFTPANLVLGGIAALLTGLSKTAVPGAGLLAVPLLAMVASGRLIVGITLPILLLADVFAVRWYRHHTRWELIRPLAGWVLLGYAAGIAFFVLVGSRTRPLDVVIGVIVLVMVAVQVVRVLRRRPPKHSTPGDAALYGTSGGFTTFVSNAAGPIINTYLVGLGLDRRDLVGTSAWFYFLVNLSKLPIYAALGAWVAGGPFFTRDGLLFDLAVSPAVIVGVFAGRALLHRIPERLFLWLVLVLSAGGALRLLLG